MEKGKKEKKVYLQNFMTNEKKYKPVVYSTNSCPSRAQNTTQQMLLLKGLQITSDPQELKTMMGVKTVSDVYRTLDKLSIRKDYHQALERAGLDMDFVVKGLQSIAVGAERDSDRLSAFKTILQSLGLDKYESSDSPTGGTWEAELLKALERDKEQKQLNPGAKSAIEIDDYEVKVPELPESARKLREEEEALTKSIYG